MQIKMEVNFICLDVPSNSEQIKLPESLIIDQDRLTHVRTSYHLRVKFQSKSKVEGGRMQGQTHLLTQCFESAAPN